MVYSNFKKVRDEETIILVECQYSQQFLEKCRNRFQDLIKNGTAKGSFDEDSWELYDLTWYGLSFSLNKEKYASHIGKRYGISYVTMINMLKGFALYCYGNYVIPSIRNKVYGVVKFLERYSDYGFILNQDEYFAVGEFLGFISTPEDELDYILATTKHKPSKEGAQRKLKPLITYLVIAKAVSTLYESEIDDETFVKWFPVFFWVSITFIWPLRVTEMLVTPFDCLKKRGELTYLSIRRTLLKGGHISVFYDVTRDYAIETRKIPNGFTANMIEKYLKLTSNHKRRFLLDYDDKTMINEMLSPAAFNHLLARFIDEYVNNNYIFDYVKYAMDINQFEYVTAGDSRPIALINLVYNGVAVDVSSELAAHNDINTTAFYYTNTSEIIHASSVMQMLELYMHDRQTYEEEKKRLENSIVVDGVKGCILQKDPNDHSYLDVCRSSHHVFKCIGCDKYNHTKEELDEYLNEYKNATNDSMNDLIDFIDNTVLDDQKISITDLLLTVQRNGSMYKIGTDIYAKEKLVEWERIRNSQKKFF